MKEKQLPKITPQHLRGILKPTGLNKSKTITPKRIQLTDSSRNGFHGRSNENFTTQKSILNNLQTSSNFYLIHEEDRSIAGAAIQFEPFFCNKLQAPKN